MPRRIERDSETVYLSEYSISFDAVKNNDGCANSLLRILGDQRMEELNTMLTEDSGRAIEQLKPLLEQHPDVPMLYNWLLVAYQVQGDIEKAGEIALANYQRDPNYLFARLNYAQYLMHHGKLEEVAEVFDDTWDLKMLYPHRNEFHITEFLGFQAIVIQYMMRIGNDETAQMLFDMMKRVAPDARQTLAIEQLMTTSWLMKKARGFLGRIARPRRAVTA